MDWSKGYSSAFYVNEVDKSTWKDFDRIEIKSGSVSVTDEGLRNAADFDCTEFDTSRELWVRIYMDTKQGGESAHVPLFTGMASAPDRDINGRSESMKVKCYSVLQPAQDVLLPRGWYAPTVARASVILEDLLSVTPAPVEVDGITPSLAEPIVAEENESHLTMADRILTAIGWRMVILGDGTILIEEESGTPVQLMDPNENDIIETQLTESYDWQSVPNVIRASTSMRSVTYRDESDSILSVPNRGREIWLEEADVNLNDGESLESYAERRLKEEQGVCRTVSYTRIFDPDIHVTDIVELRYPEQNISGYFRITSQNISLGYGAPVSEEVRAYE